VNLGDRLRSAREARGLTQDALARLIGASVMSIKNWEANRRVPRSHIGALEHVLGIQLRGVPLRDAPRLDEATDAQLVSEFNARLAERTLEIHTLRARLAELGELNDVPTGDGDATEDPRPVTRMKWAARAREASDQ
jgi:transcriptional regulator with XRE-family HTH domain